MGMREKKINGCANVAGERERCEFGAAFELIINKNCYDSTQFKNKRLFATSPPLTPYGSLRLLTAPYGLKESPFLKLAYF